MKHAGYWAVVVDDEVQALHPFHHVARATLYEICDASGIPAPVSDHWQGVASLMRAAKDDAIKVGVTSPCLIVGSSPNDVTHIPSLAQWWIAADGPTVVSLWRVVGGHAHRVASRAIICGGGEINRLPE